MSNLIRVDTSKLKRQPPYRVEEYRTQRGNPWWDIVVDRVDSDDCLPILEEAPEADCHAIAAMLNQYDELFDFYEMVKKSLTKVEEELGAALYEKMILHRKLDAAIEIAITCATDAWCGTEEELRASILEDIEKEMDND